MSLRRQMRLTKGVHREARVVTQLAFIMPEKVPPGQRRLQRHLSATRVVSPRSFEMSFRLINSKSIVLYN